MIIGILPLVGQQRIDEGPWKYFVQGLQAQGSTAVDLRGCNQGVDGVVVFNRTKGVKGLIQRAEVSEKRTALIVLEPRVSLPTLYQESYLRQFSHRFAASPLWAREIGAEPFLWPQNVLAEKVQGEFSADAAMACANKRSAVRGSLYGLRRRVIRVFEDGGPRLALYGEGWHSSRRGNLGIGGRAAIKALVAGSKPDIKEAFSEPNLQPNSWRGYVADKSVGLASAPVSVVIENSADYVSEKLVDAVRLGRIPIYVGPPLTQFSLPSEIAISVSPDAEEVVRAVAKATSMDMDSVLNCGKEWLESRDSQAHDARVVLSNLGEEVAQSLT